MSKSLVILNPRIASTRMHLEIEYKKQNLDFNRSFSKKRCGNFDSLQRKFDEPALKFDHFNPVSTKLPQHMLQLDDALSLVHFLPFLQQCQSDPRSQTVGAYKYVRKKRISLTWSWNALIVHIYMYTHTEVALNYRRMCWSESTAGSFGRRSLSHLWICWLVLLTFSSISFWPGVTPGGIKSSDNGDINTQWAKCICDIEWCQWIIINTLSPHCLIWPVIIIIIFFLTQLRRNLRHCFDYWFCPQREWKLACYSWSHRPIELECRERERWDEF